MKTIVLVALLAGFVWPTGTPMPGVFESRLSSFVLHVQDYKQDGRSGRTRHSELLWA